MNFSIKTISRFSLAGVILLLATACALIADGKSDGSRVQPLAGEWGFQLDPQDLGIKENWAAKSLTAKAQLPGTTATNGLGEATKGAAGGQLTPAFRYVGPAWYQRTVEIPSEWAGKQVTLHLERVLMRSSVWVDGKPVGGPIDFLGVPHEHPLGSLAPGKHTITVRVDNRNVLNAGLGGGHHYYDGMQTIWNGLVGRLELVATPAVALDLVRLFPSYKDGTVGIETTVINGTGAAADCPLRVIIREKQSKNVVAQATFTVAATVGKNTGKHELKLKKPPRPWDEFQPNLYQVEVLLGTGTQIDTYRADIGFRDLGATEYHLTINGRPLFYRNNHDGCIFPLTGYPPTDVESWRKILGIYKAHGLNGIRFHSWTPPEAVFTAADELGLYVQSEHFWNQMDATPEMADFARQEMRAGLDRYGNHPSNCYVLYGNELGGNLNHYGDWLKADRAYDPRHLYSVAAGRRVTGDDFSEYGVKMNWAAPFTDWDYRGYFARWHLKALPETTHELGQPVTHPDWRELAKYTGVLKPRNYEKFRELARAAGVEAQSAEFQKASGNINRLNYKLDIEALMRTPQSAGYNLLDMHDYSGQGEALVGWLDAFYESKGFLTAEEFSHYGSATVPLARLPKFVFTEGETLAVKAELAHYGAAPLPAAELQWTLKNDAKQIVASGKLAPVAVPVGSVTRLGEIAWPLKSASPQGEHLVLDFTIAGTPYANHWDLWVFPKPDQPAEPAYLLITADPAAALPALDAGRKVLLLANRLGKGNAPGAYACFKPPFWSTNYGFGQQSRVMGAVVRKDHPALALFPTADVLDLQWQTLCPDLNDYDLNPTNAWRDQPQIGNPNGRGFILKGFPASYRPIVQPVPDFQRPSKIGTIFEVKTQAGGRLLVCGYDIADQLDSRPVARQLRKSLLTYLASAKFAPDYVVDNEWLLSTFEKADRPIPMPAGYEKAYLYVKAGGRHPTKEGNAACEPQWDASSRLDDGTHYTVQGATTWADEGGTAWAGSKIRIEIKVKEAVSGILKVRFHDWNQRGRRGIVRSEDGQKQELGAHDTGVWLEFPLRREDSLDGIIVLEAETTAGPNLMITDLAIVPR
jgi:hypothetical protein